MHAKHLVPWFLLIGDVIAEGLLPAILVPTANPVIDYMPHCSGCHVPYYFTTPTPQACQNDPSASCSLYNATLICDRNGTYYLWARKNCPLFCGFCQVITCRDNPSANCALYSPSAICDVNSIYSKWASMNCAKRCGFCKDPLAQENSGSNTEACRDTLNCKVYSSVQMCNRTGIYYQWAKKNCPLYCGFCQAPTIAVPCKDKLPNCYDYQRDLCRNPLFRLWREDNCRQFCGICSGTDHVHVLDKSAVLG